MNEPIEYIPAYLAARRYFIYQNWSVGESTWRGKPAPREVSKLWYYWCKWRKWRYQENPYNGMLVKINKFTKQYHFQENWDSPTSAEIWQGIGNTLGRISKKGR